MSSGNDREVRIGIAAETSGADEAKRALEDVKKAGEDAGKGTAEAAKEATKAVEDLAAASEAAGDARKKEAQALKSATDAAEKLAAAEAALADSTQSSIDVIFAKVAASSAAGDAAFDAAIREGKGWEEAEEAQKKARDATGEHLKSLQQTAKVNGEVASSTKKVTEESKQLRTLLTSQGLGAASELFGKMASGLQDSAVALKDVNPELAETAATGAKVAGVLGAVASGAAGGMAFGPWGAAIGAIIPLIGELGSEWAETMAEGEKGAKAYEDGLEQVRRKLAETAAERGRLADEQFRESIEREADSYRRLNEEMADNIQLSKARRAARNEVENAKDDAELATIDNNKDLSEAEKIKRKGVINSRRDDRRAQDRLDDATDHVKQAQAEAATKEEAAKAASKATKQAQERLQVGEERRDELKPKVQAQRDLDGAQKVVEQAEESLQAAKNAQYAPDYSETGMPTSDSKALAEDVKKAEAAVEAAHENLKQIRSIAANEKEIAELRELENKGLEERKKILADRVKEEAKAKEEAADSAKKRDVITAVETETAQGIIAARQIDRRTQANTTDAKVQQAESRKKQNDDREHQNKQREATEDKLSRSRAALNEAAMNSAGKFSAAAAAGKDRSPEASAELSKISKRLADGTDGNELKQIAEEFEKVARGSTSETLKALRSMLDAQMKQAEEIRRLQANLKKGVPNGS